MPRKASKPPPPVQRHISQIKRQIAALDLVCPGTLIERFICCGKPNCRCATDPQHRHGPYLVWSRRAGGRLVHSTIAPAQAQTLRRAIHNHRRILDLLTEWGQESASFIRSKTAGTTS